LQHRALLFLFSCVQTDNTVSFVQKGLLSSVWKLDSLETRTQNCEKRLLVSTFLSVRPDGTTRLPLDGFS
jgi:hypothetical protein